LQRGGRRAGKPATPYANRSDLNSAKSMLNKTAPSEQYGSRAKQEASIAAVPPAPPPASPAPGSPPAGAGEAGLPDLFSPTFRPDEPLSHGAPFGPGGGPEILNLPGQDPTALQLRAIYARFPNEDLRELIEGLDQGSL
jgi:hypothetical protein